MPLWGESLLDLEWRKGPQLIYAEGVFAALQSCRTRHWGRGWRADIANIAVVELDLVWLATERLYGQPGIPRMISPRARGVVRIIQQDLVRADSMKRYNALHDAAIDRVKRLAGGEREQSER